MTVVEYEQLSAFEKAMLDEMKKIRVALEKLGADL